MLVDFPPRLIGVQVLEEAPEHRRPAQEKPRPARTFTGTCSSARRPSGPTPRSIIPHNWRGWWDFGTGALGDMACHTANLAVHGPEARAARRASSAESGEINPETYPAWATITYEFPARGDLPPVKLTWYEGSQDGKRYLPPEELFPEGLKLVRQRLAARRREGPDRTRPATTAPSRSLWPEADVARDVEGARADLPRTTARRRRRQSEGRVGRRRSGSGKPRGRPVELRLRRAC